MVSSSPESNFFESNYQPKHYFSRDKVNVEEWIEDNEERIDQDSWDGLNFNLSSNLSI